MIYSPAGIRIDDPFPGYHAWTTNNPGSTRAMQDPDHVPGEGLMIYSPAGIRIDDLSPGQHAWTSNYPGSTRAIQDPDHVPDEGLMIFHLISCRHH